MKKKTVSEQVFAKRVAGKSKPASMDPKSQVMLDRAKGK